MAFEAEGRAHRKAQRQDHTHLSGKRDQLTYLHTVLMKLALLCFLLSKDTIHTLCLSLLVESLFVPQEQDYL